MDGSHTHTGVSARVYGKTTTEERIIALEKNEMVFLAEVLALSDYSQLREDMTMNALLLGRLL